VLSASAKKVAEGDTVGIRKGEKKGHGGRNDRIIGSSSVRLREKGT